jgi:signal transduction histidine kinase
VREQLAPLSGDLEVEYWTGLPLDEVVERVRHLPADTIVLPATFRADPSGRVLVPNEATKRIIDASAAPTYSVYDYQLGRGLVGAYTASFAEEGRVVADLAADVIEGNDLGPEPVVRTVPNAYRVDARELERWGFSRENLPPDTIVMFEEPSLWAEHRDLVLAALAIIALQSALVVALLVQRRRRRLAEAETALQRREVAHLMRVSVLGELSGAIAHEINQPLTAILSNAHAALDMVPDKAAEFAELRETIADIIEEDNRAAEVINRLRNLMRKGTRMVEPIDVNGLVEATAALLRSELIARRIDLRTDLAAGAPIVRGDPVQIQQVLLNLIMNAMDAMAAIPAGQRTLTVSTSVAADGGAAVTVSDKGIGLQEGNSPFDPFYTTKEHGLGLGLTICMTIVEAHGGTLTLANADGGGATARFFLPRAGLLAAAE